jgi:rhodanese-related sulfurtransferase
MAQALPSISAAELYDQLGTASAPMVVDVRRPADFASADTLIVSAFHRDPDQVEQWRRELSSRARVVVHCVHGHQVSQGVAAALRAAGIDASYLQGGIADWIETGFPTYRPVRTTPGKWVTREHPKIDRIACPWLIRRFTHEGERCSFDTILRIYGIKDAALDHLAEIVRGADTSRHDLAPQCGGLFAISLGLSANFPDDHEMLGHGMVMYDALYTWCRSLQAETHNWPATAVKEARRG